MAELLTHAALPRTEKTNLYRLNSICANWEVRQDDVHAKFGGDMLRSERFLKALHKLSSVVTFSTAVLHLEAQQRCRREGTTKQYGLDRTKAWCPHDVEEVLKEVNAGSRASESRSLRARSTTATANTHNHETDSTREDSAVAQDEYVAAQESSTRTITPNHVPDSNQSSLRATTHDASLESDSAQGLETASHGPSQSRGKRKRSDPGDPAETSSRNKRRQGNIGVSSTSD